MAKPVAKSYFTTFEVVVLTGFTKYMLDYLERDKVFVRGEDSATGRRGRARRYSFTDVVWLRALHTICSEMGRIRHLRGALARLRDRHGPIQPGTSVSKRLFVHGNEIFSVSESKAIERLRDGQLAFSFVVDLGRITEEIGSKVLVELDTGRFVVSPKVARIAKAHRRRHWLHTSDLRNPA